MAKQNYCATYENCFDPENATPDSQLLSTKQGKIVNESSLFADEVQDYSLDGVDLSDEDDDFIGLESREQAMDSDDGDC